MSWADSNRRQFGGNPSVCERSGTIAIRSNWRRRFRCTRPVSPGLISMTDSWSRSISRQNRARRTRSPPCLPRTLVIGLGTEIRHVDHERSALPAAARVAVPLAYVGRKVRAPVHDDVTLPPLPLTDVVEDRDAARRLHDAAEAAVVGSKFGKPAGQAALRYELSSGPSLRFIRAVL